MGKTVNRKCTQCGGKLEGHALRKFCGHACYHANEMRKQAARRKIKGRSHETASQILRRQKQKRAKKMAGWPTMNYLKSKKVRDYFAERRKIK